MAPPIKRIAKQFGQYIDDLAGGKAGLSDKERLAEIVARAVNRGGMPKRVKTSKVRPSEEAEEAMTGADRIEPPSAESAEAAEGIPSLRGMPMDQAIETARAEPHLVPKEGGGFVGAPESVLSKEDLAKVRESFDAAVAEGISGADWYERAKGWIKSVVGKSPARQREMSNNLALMSSQADPKSNLGFSILARNNAMMGMTPKGSEGQEGIAHTGRQWRDYKATHDEAPYIDNPQIGHNQGPVMDTSRGLGPKTRIYAQSMDPTQQTPTTGTNDIWHGRQMGYTRDGEQWDEAFSPTQHRHMDYETVLGVDRARQAKLGGRDDWTSAEIQAAPWIVAKGEGLFEKNRAPSREAGIAEASKTYPDYVADFTASGTHEAVPGKRTRHLPQIGHGDQQTRDEFSDMAGDWRNDEGRDVIYEAQGNYTQPTVDIEGIFEGGFNRAQAASPTVTFAGPQGERTIEPASKQMLQGGEAFRSFFDAQDMGAWSVPLGGQKVGHNNAMRMTLPTPNPTRDELADIIGITGRHGLENVVHRGGTDAVATQFYPGKQGIGAREMKAMNKDLGGRASVTPTRLESDYTDYTKEWEQPEGSDQATRKMLGSLNEDQLTRLDSEAVRAKVLQRFERDAAVALERGDVVREDIQLARKLFAEGGFRLLKEHLNQGLLPAAVGALFLPALMEEEEQNAL